MIEQDDYARHVRERQECAAQADRDAARQGLRRVPDPRIAEIERLAGKMVDDWRQFERGAVKSADALASSRAFLAGLDALPLR